VSDLSKAHLLTAVANEDPTVITAGGLYMSAQKVSSDTVDGKAISSGSEPVRHHAVSDALCAEP